MSLPAGPGKTPRAWQSAALDSLRQALYVDWMGRGPIDRALVEAATGCGKCSFAAGVAVLTVWMSWHRMREGQPGAKERRVLLLAHRDELCGQLVEAIREIQGAPRVGVVKGTRNEWLNPIVVGSVQSLTPARMAKGGVFDVIIRDEAHHALSPTDQAIYACARERNPNVKIIGVSATPYLSGPKGTTKGLGKAFDDIVFSYPLPEAIEAGDLVPIKGIVVPVEVSMEGVRHGKDGEINEDDAAARLDFEEFHDVVIDKYLEHAKGKPALVFCCNVAHSQHMAERFNARGVKAAAVWGDMAADDRKRLIAEFREHPERLPVLCSNDLIREGFDAPRTYAVMKVRPTESMVVLMQMIGRGTRVEPATAKVISGYSDPAAKRAAIAASPKPHMLFVDFTYGGCELDLTKAMANMDADDPPTREGKGLVVGDMVERRGWSDWKYGPIREIEEVEEPVKHHRALVAWPVSKVHPAGAELWHPIRQLKRAPAAAEDEEPDQPGEQIVRTVVGVGEYELILLPGQKAEDPGVIGWYEHNGTFSVGGTAGDLGKIKMHVRPGTKGWEVWSIRPGLVKRGEDPKTEIATCQRDDCDKRETAIAWANAHLRAHNVIVQPISADWKGNPATEKQARYLRSLGIRRDLSEMCAGEASALIDAVSAYRTVTDKLNPGLAQRREHMRAKFRGAGRKSVEEGERVSS